MEKLRGVVLSLCINSIRTGVATWSTLQFIVFFPSPWQVYAHTASSYGRGGLSGLGMSAGNLAEGRESYRSPQRQAGVPQYNNNGYNYGH